MENETCMEYLFHSIGSDHANNINQEILLNASNEFRNIWNLVKKLRDLARVDVKKITSFLDAVQEGLQKGTWSAATRICLQADNEYRHIRRYIRPSFLEDFKVSLYIVKADHSGKSATKREKKMAPTSVNGSRKQSFRNRQINKQDPMSNLGDKVGNESNVKKIDVKKHKMVDKPNENKNSNKESTNTKLKTSDGKKIDEAKDKSNIVSKSPSKTYIPVVLDSINHRSGPTKPDFRQTLENCDNNEDYETKHNEKAISSNSNISTREEGDGSERKKQSKEIESKRESASNHTDTLEVVNQEDTAQEKGIKDDHGHAEDSLKPVCKLAENVNEKVQEQDNLRSDANKTVCNDTNENAHDMLAKESTNTSLKESNSSAAENGAKSQEKSHVDNVEDDMSVPIDTTKMVSDQMTRINFKCKPEEIITELSHVYETDWNRAYTALTGCQPSNGIKNTIDFLGEILKLSAGDVRKAVESTLRFRDDKISVLETLQKMKQEFLTRHLKELQKEHSIEYHNGDVDENAVNLYSAKCVELSWFMLTRNPPMVFDYDSRPMLLEDLLEIFRPYKNEGHCIHYIVWPAIRRSKHDVVVAQGIAEFR